MTFEPSHVLLAQQTAPGTTTAPAGDPAVEGAAPKSAFGGMMPIFIMMFVMMYFLMIRPQQKRAKEHKARMESLKIGSKVISAGGIHGLVTNVSDKTVTVKVSDNAKIKFEKASITQVFGSGKDDDASAEADASDDEVETETETADSAKS